MSKQDGSQTEPLAKRQKRRDVSLGGPMYDEATARKILQAAVLIPAKYAEDGEAVIGFDPDVLNRLYYVDDGHFFLGENITPMIYFAQWGDVKMCRYLISRGASTTKAVQDNAFCPMFAAADAGHLDVCKLLYANGAQKDLRRDDGYGWTPFHIAAASRHASVSSRDEIVRWLVLHGALFLDANSKEIGGDRIYPEGPLSRGNRSTILRSCERLVEWAEEVTQTHSSVVIFLLGALPPAPGKEQSRTLQCLSGHPGVRKHIADFVGLEVTKGKHLRILRQVVDVLPSFIRTD